MCQICQLKPVYEFTNKRKVCARCFIRWFQKKVLYTIRKFKMIQHNDIISYQKSNTFSSVVLEDVLKMFSRKTNIKLVKLPAHLHSQIDKKIINKKISNEPNNKYYYINNVSQRKILPKADLKQDKSRASKSERGQFKIAIPSTTDSEANKIIHTIIQGKTTKLKQFLPVNKKIIKPLYLFLDKEVLLYAKIKGLRFKKPKEKKDKISTFIDELEKKHPEIKRAIISSLVELY